MIGCSDKSLIYRVPCLVTAEILYYMPDYPLLLQSFIWQTNDIAPLFPRIQRFLDFWKTSIHADVHSVTLNHVPWVGASDFKVRDCEITQ